MTIADHRDPLRITYVTNSLEIGGAETSLIALSRWLVARGHAITVVSSGGPLESDLAKAGARHIRLPITLNAALVPRAMVGLRGHVRRDRPDVLHALSAAGAVATQLSPRAPYGPLVLSSPMGLQNSDREPGYITVVRNLMLALRMQRIFVISEEIERAMRELPFFRGVLVHQNVNGIDLERFRAPDPAALRQLRDELGVGSAPLITTIGALHPRKSHDLFVRAAATVARQRPDARYLLVGEGRERKRLEQLRDELGLAERLLMLGARRDVPAILATSTVCVKPGIVEGFIGLTVLEAQAVGTPVVAFDTRDVRAAIVDGETGLIAPNGDVRHLAHLILQLLEDPLRRAALASAGRRLVEQRFSLDAVAAGVERAYFAALADVRP